MPKDPNARALLMMDDISAYQDALNRIPPLIRDHSRNRGYTWEVDQRIPGASSVPGGRLGFTVDRSGNPINSEPVVNVAPDDEPPFFLEGPNRRPDDEDDPGEGPSSGPNFFGDLGSLGAFGGSGGGAAFNGFHKRESLPQAKAPDSTGDESKDGLDRIGR
ncbi:hypothetical protein TWF281_010242 [Arthrobotrys megalospora]